MQLRRLLPTEGQFALTELSLKSEARQISAWIALSNLFLDTELDDRDIEGIARELIATEFSVNEIKRMYEEEVASACWKNAYALPGGAWMGFDRDWLVAEVNKKILHPGPFHRVSSIRRWRIHAWTIDSRKNWNRVLVCLQS